MHKALKERTKLLEKGTKYGGIYADVPEKKKKIIYEAFNMKLLH